MQIHILLRALCQLHNIDVPNEIVALTHGECSNAVQVDDCGAQAIEDQVDDQMDDKNGTDEIIDVDEIESDQEVELDDSLFVVYYNLERQTKSNCTYLVLNFIFRPTNSTRMHNLRSHIRNFSKKW